MIEIPKTSECEKWNSWGNHWTYIKDFLDWLAGKNIVLAEYIQYPEDHPYYPEWREYPIPLMKTTLDLYYEYCEVDPNKLETERRALLDYIRELNKDE